MAFIQTSPFSPKSLTFFPQSCAISFLFPTFALLFN